MIRERVAEDVYVFTSERYASVNAGAVVGPQYSVLIDTLPLPEETRQIRDFLKNDLEREVRYIILTHSHADHSNGVSMFKDALVLGHRLCRDLLDTRGRSALEEARTHNRDLQDVRIVLPDLVLDDGMIGVRVGERSVQLVPLPGHSKDGTGALIMDDRVLFAGDIMMPVPFLADGDYDVMVDSLKRIPKMKLESLVQGHGDVILRGEVSSAVKENLSYLRCIAKHVRQAGRRKEPDPLLHSLDVTACGKSRILLNGLAEDLHQRNLTALYQAWYGEKE